MRDFARLRREIFLAVTLAGAPAGLACSKDPGPGAGGTGPDAPPAAKAEPDATVTAEPDATVTAEPPPAQPDAAVATVVPEPPEARRRPTCPTGDFCAPAKDVKKVKRKPAPGEEADKDVLGCPAVLASAPTPRPAGVPDRDGLWIRVDEAATQAKRDVADAATCCYQWTIPCPGGRALLAEGDRPAVAPARRGQAWTAAGVAEAPAAEALPEVLRAALAAAWRADALAEHASVASFARASLELMAVGAPPELIAACHAAALDEIRHAEVCFALAACHGERVEPGALPAVAPRAGGLARLAADTFVEGCVGETVAAVIVARAAGGCEDAEVAARLAGIARDEERHAALAWRTVAWAVRRGGAEVAEAVRAAATRAAAEAAADDGRGEAEDEAFADALLAHGRLSARAQRRVRDQVWREIITPALARLA